MKTLKWVPAVLFIALNAFVFASCAGLAGGDDEVELSGESAFDYIRKDYSKAPKTDVESIKEIIGWAIEDHQAKKRLKAGEPLAKSADASRVEPSEAVMAILRKTTKPRKNFSPDGFERIDFSSFQVENPADPAYIARYRLMNEVNLSDLDDEFYVDNLDAIPVRNQGYRGTCAAFTGTGHIEYAVLKQYDTLPTIDLSEQRYYYLSKPECWANGCSLADEGSWYATAMEASVEDGGSLDIPLETDCPYSSQPGENDLQTPQLASCETGAVGVKELEYVKGAKEIVEALHETKLPVPFASPLSGNWERNDGLITHADSGYEGNTSHAGGHAYLIVGYKKLPDMPEEGGMCFVIKNSWGTGWGVNGYSCMTLEWVKHWNFGFELSHPVVQFVMLREDLQEAEELPNNEEAEDETAPDVPDESEEDDTADTDKTDDEVEEEIDNLPDPDEDDSLQWNAVKVFGPGEMFFQGEYAKDGDDVHFRGVLRETNGRTNKISLTADSTKPGRLLHGVDRVGDLDEAKGMAHLCSGQYDLICSLRFDTDKNRLYIEFPYPDNRRVDEDTELVDGSWKSLDIPFGDYSFDYYEPKKISSLLFEDSAYIRMGKKSGEKTEPIRMGLDGTKIKVMGEEVGSINPSNLGLCTGSYAEACSIFSSGDELNILPSW